MSLLRSIPILMACLAFGLGLAGCGGGGGGGAAPPPAAPNITPAAGGSVDADDGKLVLSVPAGAASAPANVTLAAIANPPAPAGTQLLAGTTYTLGGDGGALDAEAELSFTLDEALPAGLRPPERVRGLRARPLYAIVPACDVNGDGVVDAVDADLWQQGYDCYVAPTLVKISASAITQLGSCTPGGSRTLNCKALTLSPGVIGVLFDKTAPTVSLDAFDFPVAPNKITSPGPYTLLAGASDNVGVVRVDFYKVATLGIQVIRTKLHTAAAPPYEYTFSLSNADNGDYILLAEAVDTSGNVAGRGAKLSVDVPLPPVPDTEAPIASMSINPTQLQVGEGSTVTVQATDNVGVVKVEIYKNGVKATETTSSGSALVTLAHGPADVGTITYTGRAYDAAGNVGMVAGTLTVLPGPAEAWVNAGTGSDTNAGTQAAPFKTLGKAFSSVGPGGIVRLLGTTTFSAANEGLGGPEVFTGIEVPAGVAIKAQTYGVQDIGVTLRFPGGGSIENVRFDASTYGRVLAGGGTLTLSRPQWFKGGANVIAYGIEASGSAEVMLDDGGVAGHDYVASGLTGFAWLSGSAELTVQGGKVGHSTGQASGAFLVADTSSLRLENMQIVNENGTWVGGEGAIVVAGTASPVALINTRIDLANAPAACILQDNSTGGVVGAGTGIGLIGATLENCAGGGIQLREGTPALSVTNSTIRNNGGFAVWAGQIGFDSSGSGQWGRPSIGIGNSTLSGNFQGSISMNRGGWLRVITSVLSGGARGLTIGSEGSYDVQVSGSAITATTDAVWLGGDAASEFDFGDPGGLYTSDGGNTFSGGTTGLRVSVAVGVVVKASNNTWKASVQGANASGQYTNAACGGASPCEVTAGSGGNYTFSSAGAGARLRLAP